MTDAAALRDLWEIHLEDEPLPEGADGEAGVGHLARLVRGAAIPIVDAVSDRGVARGPTCTSGDPGVLSTGGRPFRTTGEMDGHLPDAWRRQVRPEDLLVTLGDVVHPALWVHPPPVAALRNCPGRRILVLGNHDVAEREGLCGAGVRGAARGRAAPPTRRWRSRTSRCAGCRPR